MFKRIKAFVISIQMGIYLCVFLASAFIAGRESGLARSTAIACPCKCECSPKSVQFLFNGNKICPESAQMLLDAYGAATGCGCCVFIGKHREETMPLIEGLVEAAPARSGWFRHGESGRIEYWSDGLRTHVYSAGDPEFDAAVLEMPLHVRRNLGLAGDVATEFTGPLFGVLERPAREPAYWIGGRHVNRDEAIGAIFAGDAIADDSKKWFLTAVLADGPRKQFLEDVDKAPALSEVKSRYHVNAYAPNDAHVLQSGHAEGITFQPPGDANGKAKPAFRLPTYAGPDVLAAALRKADPAYQPAKDPDPSKPPPKPPDPPKQDPLPQPAAPANAQPAAPQTSIEDAAATLATSTGAGATVGLALIGAFHRLRRK